ncbi:MAG TPA: CBS domain-containing protein [Thermoanaerobaculia bacterium]|jgi:CBS domain-containing protein|nr:CBS domain-containing protein [Thermoanaerobaculia bacterium]
MIRLRVRDLMTEGVYAVNANDHLATVSDLMDAHGIRHAPVVEEGRLVGLISHRDLLRHALKGQVGVPPDLERGVQLSITAGEVMTRDVVTAAPDQDIREAARLMLEGKFGCLPVVEDTRLVGILTESDFVRFLASGD